MLSCLPAVLIFFLALGNGRSNGGPAVAAGPNCAAAKSDRRIRRRRQRPAIGKSPRLGVLPPPPTKPFRSAAAVPKKPRSNRVRCRLLLPGSAPLFVVLTAAAILCTRPCLATSLGKPQVKHNTFAGAIKIARIAINIFTALSSYAVSAPLLYRHMWP